MAPPTAIGSEAGVHGSASRARRVPVRTPLPATWTEEGSSATNGSTEEPVLRNALSLPEPTPLDSISNAGAAHAAHAPAPGTHGGLGSSGGIYGGGVGIGGNNSNPNLPRSRSNVGRKRFSSLFQSAHNLAARAGPGQHYSTASIGGDSFVDLPFAIAARGGGAGADRESVFAGSVAADGQQHHGGTSASSQGNLVNSGFLVRRGPLLQWKRYWVEARAREMGAGLLVFFRDAPTAQQGDAPLPRALVDLSQCVQVIVKERKPGTERHVFKLCMRGGDMLLAADTAEAAEAWARDLSALVPKIAQPGLAKLQSQLASEAEQLAAALQALAALRAEHAECSDRADEIAADRDAHAKRADEAEQLARRLRGALSDAQSRSADVGTALLDSLRADLDVTIQALAAKIDQQGELAEAAHDRISKGLAGQLGALKEAVHSKTAASGKEQLDRLHELITIQERKDRKAAEADQLAPVIQAITKLELANNEARRDVEKQLQQLPGRVTDRVQQMEERTVAAVQQQLLAQRGAMVDGVGVSVKKAVDGLHQGLNNLTARDSSASDRLARDMARQFQQVQVAITQAHEATQANNEAALVTAFKDHAAVVDGISQALSDKINKLVAHQAEESQEVVGALSQVIKETVREHLLAQGAKLDALSAQGEKQHAEHLQRAGEQAEALHKLHEEQIKEIKAILQSLPPAPAPAPAPTSAASSRPASPSGLSEFDHHLLLSIESRLDRLVTAMEQIKRGDTSSQLKIDQLVTKSDEIRASLTWANRGSLQTAHDRLVEVADRLESVASEAGAVVTAAVTAQAAVPEKPLHAADSALGMDGQGLAGEAAGAGSPGPVPTEEQAQEARRLQALVDALSGGRAALAHEIDHLHGQRALLQQEALALEARRDAARVQLAEAQAAVAAAAVRRDEQATDAQEVAEDIDNARRTLAGLQAAVAAARGDLAALAADFAQFEGGAVARVQTLVDQARVLEGTPAVDA